MLNGKKIIVVMPAYNAEKTLERTYNLIPHNIVDEVILVDDQSSDQTVAKAQRLRAKVFVHDRNKGYGANQKTCYTEALKSGADIVVMLHPDYQYNPRLITAMSSLVAEGIYDVVLGSRILGGHSLEGALPLLENSDDFVFDNQMLLQALYFNFKVGEISCPTKYETDSSSINFGRSLKYGGEVLWTASQYALAKAGWGHFAVFDREGRR